MRTRCSAGCGRNVNQPGPCEWCEARQRVAVEVMTLLLTAGGDDQGDDEEAT